MVKGVVMRISVQLQLLGRLRYVCVLWAVRRAVACMKRAARMGWGGCGVVSGRGKRRDGKGTRVY